MSDVATYVHIATYHGMKLNFPVNWDHFKWCQVSSDEFVYEWLAASPEFWKLGVNRILTLLDEALSVTFDGRDPANTAIIAENLFASDSIYKRGDGMPYFWLLSAHQETMWPLTAALGLDRAAKLPFASAYFFEFYSEETAGVSEDYVNTVYRDDKGNKKYVELACS